MIKPAYSLNIKGKLLELNKPMVMGILNITPDSFHAASRMDGLDGALYQASMMLEQGADILDIGAQSTRPGAEIISSSEEMARLKGIIGRILKSFPEAIISIDTFRAEVAEMALDEGATIVNDVSSGEMDNTMFEFIARKKVPYVMMHHHGIPAMSQADDLTDKTSDIVKYFSLKKAQLAALGVNDIIIDPGFGFGKNKHQNLLLLKALRQLELLDLPILVGLSRKKTVQQVLDTDAAGSLNGTIAINTIALMNGASILRVHDVKEAVETVKIFLAYDEV